MENEGLTEEQAKKIVAKTLGQQVLEAGLSGALMGAAFGAIDTSIAAYNQIENIKQLASARKLAATLPEAYRPSFDAANVTNETAAAYAVEVYLAAQRYNKAQQEAESTAQAQQAMEEKAAVSVTTLASAQQIYNAQQEARAQAQAETGTGEAAQDAQDATVLSGYGNAENAVAGEAGNINGSETEADVQARGEVAQLAQAFAGEQLIQAVGDLANDRRMAGDAQGAAALEKALADYQAGVYTGENEGGTADGREVYLRDGGEWNDGTDSGGTIRSVAESTGRDPGGDLPGNGGRPAGAGGDAPGNQSAYRTVQGSTRQVTGFRNGEVSDSVGMFEELPPELEDLRQQVVKNGYSIRFTDGVMQFRTKRGTATVDGVYANGEIVVNARSAKWATEQLVNHEMFHGFARENDGLVDAMVAKVFGDLTDAQIEEIVAKYQEAYKDAGLSRQQALEEICADAFAGMDRKNIGLAGRMDAAREFVGQQTGAQAATGMDIQGQTRAGRDNRTSTQTGKAAGSVAGGFVRGEAYSKVSIDGEFYEPSDAQLVRTHKTIHVVPAGNARYASGVRMSKEEYNRYRDEQSEKLRRTFGVYTNRDTAYSDTYGLIEAEIGTKTMRKARSTGGVALLDIMPKLADIFENAVVLGTKADRANDTNLKGIVDLLGCADLGNGNIAIVKLNVKEYTNDEAKLYGSRIVEIEKLTVLAGVGHSSSGGSTSYAASFDPILRRYREAVNREAENSPIRSGKEKETSEPNFSIAGVQARTADRAALEDAYKSTKSFSEQIEDFKAGKIPKNDTLLVSGTPDVLRGIGLLPLPMTINQTHVDYAVNGTKDFDHFLTEEGLKQLPEALKHPVAVMVSKTRPNTSIIVLLEVRQNGKQVVAPVVVDGFGYQNGMRLDSNAITSVYGKDFSINRLLYDAIENERKGQFSLYYLDKKSSTELLRGARVLMPKMLANIPDGTIHMVTDPDSPVKAKFSSVTQTQQFRRWFGNSKVVNDDGSPKIVYHQTGKDFTVFNTDNPAAGLNDSETPNGIFFKENDHDIGLEGSRQMAVYLKMEKPLHFKDRKEANGWYCKNVPGYDALQNEMRSKIDPISKKMDDLENRMFSEEAHENQDLYDELHAEWNGLLEEMRVVEDRYRGELRALLNDYFLNGNSGYDGIMLDYDGHRYVNGVREDVKTYIVFAPNQIKSATDNVGTFDPENPDIRFSPAAGTDYDAQIREYDEKIESLELEAAGGDEAARGALR